MFKRTFFRGILGLFTVFFVGGCNGGLDCPIDPPSCCYKVVFGCGLFDLPSGCSCDQYGLGFRQSLITSGKNSIANATPGFVGTWRGSLDIESDNCGGALNRVSGGVRIHQRNSNITVSVPGYGELAGSRNKNRMAAKGGYKKGLCSFAVHTNLTSSRAGLARARASLRYSCPGRHRCEVRYRGVLQKQ